MRITVVAENQTTDKQTLAEMWERLKALPEPMPEAMAYPEFQSIWAVIQKWDIGVPEAYSGYCSATGSHAMAIWKAVVGRKNHE